MQKLELVGQIVQSLKAYEPLELVIVLGTQGSAPRSAGAWMAVANPETTFGTVGGGALEALATREGAELCAQGTSRTVRYTLGGRQSDTGMVCGGAAELLYAYVDASCLELFEQIYCVLQACADCTLEIDLSAFEVAHKHAAHGAESAVSCAGTVPMRLVEHSSSVSGRVGNRYCEPLSPEGRTYVFGCGHVGRAVTMILSACGFCVVACDDRSGVVTQELLSGASERMVVDYDHLADVCTIGPRDYVVVCTAGHRSDLSVLAQVLLGTPSYVGCLGSKKKVAHVREQLLNQGFAPEAIDQIHMPVGVEIGAETPEEIAVSIAAQMIAHRRGVTL